MHVQGLTFNAAHLGCSRDEQLLFKPVSFALQSGEGLMVEGANGVGKTTLLRVLAGLLSPACGRVTCNQSIQKNLAYLGPHNAVKGLLTPMEYLKYMTPSQENPGPLEIAKTPSLLRCARNDEVRNLNSDWYISSILEQLQLKSLENKPCASLSSGQKQRVALARIVLAKASLWILDEPMTALDKQGERIFAALLQTHLTQGGIAIIATHQALRDNHLQKIILEP